MLLKPEKDGRVYHHRREYQKQTKHFRSEVCKTCGHIYNGKKHAKCPNSGSELHKLVF